MKNSNLQKIALQLLPLFLAGAAWQFAADTDPRFKFLFASPLTVGAALVRGLQDTLPADIATTAAEILSGLALGSVVGVIVGVGIGLEKRLAAIFEPYLIVIASIPIFAIAPMTIIWFGTEFFSKVMLVFLSTVFLAAFQSYKGVTATDEGLLRYFKASGASYQFLLRHVVLPSALEWIFAACRLNIGFAILGAFVGEFIASTHGLGHYILRASGLYRVDEVLAGVLVLSVMSLALSLAVRALERHIIRWRPAIG